MDEDVEVAERDSSDTGTGSENEDIPMNTYVKEIIKNLVIFIFGFLSHWHEVFVAIISCLGLD